MIGIHGDGAPRQLRAAWVAIGDRWHALLGWIEAARDDLQRRWAGRARPASTLKGMRAPVMAGLVVLTLAAFFLQPPRTPGPWPGERPSVDTPAPLFGFDGFPGLGGFEPPAIGGGDDPTVGPTSEPAASPSVGTDGSDASSAPTGDAGGGEAGAPTAPDDGFVFGGGGTAPGTATPLPATPGPSLAAPTPTPMPTTPPPPAATSTPAPLPTAAPTAEPTPVPPLPTAEPTPAPTPVPPDPTAEPTPEPDGTCSDGVDNDGDLLVDLLDPGCLLLFGSEFAA